MANEKYPIKQEWTKYYKALEVIRESGITNMFGAAPYLREVFPELPVWSPTRFSVTGWKTTTP